MKLTLKAKRKPPIFTTLRDVLTYGARQFGDKALYFYKREKKQLTLSYKEFESMVEGFGTGLFGRGLGGAVIAVIGDGCPEYMAAYHAAVESNGVIVPLDHDIADAEIINFLRLCKARAVVYTERFNGRIAEWKDELPNVELFIPICGEAETVSREDIAAFSTITEEGIAQLKKGSRAFIDCKPVMDKMSALLFTSGTTGTSKGVMLSHRNLVCALNGSLQAMEYDDSNTFVDFLPLHHSYEITCCQFGVAGCGGTMLINDSLKNTMRNISAFRPDTLIVVPLYVETMYKKLWAEIDRRGLHMKVRAAMVISDAMLAVGIDKRDEIFAEVRAALGGNLRSIVCGGAPLSPRLIKEFASFGIFLIEGYGITECAPLIAVNRPGYTRIGSVGQPVLGCEVRIDAPDGGSSGEILARGGNVMLGYYDNEDATRAVFTDDGFFRTGDIGYIDADGYIYITGRKKNVIILSNGKNVFPEELEEHLSREPIIAESVVLARVDARGEPEITAVIYPDPALTKDMNGENRFKAVKEAVNSVNRELPVYKQIHGIELRDTEFEKTTSKKIKRYLVH